jgi:hypothetical protein
MPYTKPSYLEVLRGYMEKVSVRELVAVGVLLSLAHCPPARMHRSPRNPPLAIGASFSLTAVGSGYDRGEHSVPTQHWHAAKKKSARGSLQDQRKL